MGSPHLFLKMMRQLAACLVLALASQVRGDWTGEGNLECYSHFETTADFPEGAANAGPADVTCRPVVWDGASGKGPEAMIFHPNGGEEFDIFAWDYHDGQDSIPYATCEGSTMWYKSGDMGAGFCTPNLTYDEVTGKVKSWSGCGIAHCQGTITCTGCPSQNCQQIFLEIQFL